MCFYLICKQGLIWGTIDDFHVSHYIVINPFYSIDILLRSLQSDCLRGLEMENLYQPPYSPEKIVCIS